MKWQDWEELVCSLQRGRANEESSLREKKGYTIFRDRFDHVSRTFHRSKEHRQAYIRIGLAHDPPFLSYFLRSLLYYYIPRLTVRENQRKCAANKISHVILRSILRSPIHHDRDNASAIRSSWSRDSPRARGEESWRKKKKNHRKVPDVSRTLCSTPSPPLSSVPLYNDSSSRSSSPLPSPPPLLLPLLYSSRRRASITGFTSFECRDSITAAKRSMTRRHVGVARITKVDASRVSRVPHRESTNPPSTRETLFLHGLLENTVDHVIQVSSD